MISLARYDQFSLKQLTKTKSAIPLLLLVVVVYFLLSIPLVELKAQSDINLPGGATSLNETHGDWTVACAQNASTKTISCAMSQQLFNPQSKQRLVAIELSLDAEQTLKGVMVLPFGLKLSEGIRLRIDDSGDGLQLPFSTCLPVGCLGPISLNESAVASFRASSELKVLMTAQNDEQIEVVISLNGFTSAFNRIAALQS